MQKPLQLLIPIVLTTALSGCGKNTESAGNTVAVQSTNADVPASPGTVKSEPKLSEGSRKSLRWMRISLAGSEKNRAMGFITNDVAAQALDTIPEYPFIRSFCREQFRVMDVTSLTLDQLRDWLCLTYSITAQQADEMPAYEIARCIQEKTGRQAPSTASRSKDVITVAHKNSPLEYRFYHWQEHQLPIKLIHSSEGFCYLTQINGALNGGGEVAKVEIADDGYWYLSGKTSAGHLRLTAVAVKIKR